MSVLKIADEIDDLLKEQEQLPWGTKQVYLDLAATIIRQQQAEIEALKQTIDANNLSQNIGQFLKPANEPVAWISVLAMDKIGQKFTDVRISLTKTDVADIPLYTHPAKKLTDEEINDFTVKIYNCRTGAEAHEIVLAILRKAQEK